MKKLLALVLALVMTLSLCTISNAAFADAKDVNADYEEAVAVLNGMGVFKGYEDGSFKPTGAITRAEVAAIVYRLYTGDVKDKQADLYAGYGKFNDMAGAQWAAGYVGFCANAGFVKGYGDGKFGPSDPVTGYQALAMILRAVGYGKNGEFEGADWELHVAQIAQQLKVLKNVKNVSLKTAATRELVAELLFQVAANVDTVEYTPAFGYVANELVNVDAETLGEKNFGLKTEAATKDDFGRPCYKWVNDKTGSKKVTYATINAAAVLSYENQEVTAADLWTDLGMTTTSTNAGKPADYTQKADVKTYTDGDSNTDTITAKSGDKTNKLGGKGSTVEVYEESTDNNGVVTYCAVVINTYVDVVEKWNKAVTNKNDEITEKESIELDTGKKFETTDFTKDDVNETVVLYTKADNVIKSVKVAEMVTAKAEKLVTKSGTTTLTADGVEYVDSLKTKTKVNTLTVGTKYDLYLDTYGNVIYAVQHVDESVYAVVLDYTDTYKTSSKTKNVYEADLYYLDGTTETVTLRTSAETLVGKFVKVGTETVNKVEYTKLTAVGTIANAEIEADEPNYDGKYANNATVYFVDDGEGNITKYVGYKDMPAMNADDDVDTNSWVAYMVESVVKTDGKANLISYVYVTGYELTSETTTSYIWAQSATATTTTVKESGKDAYTTQTYTDLFEDGVQTDFVQKNNTATLFGTQGFYKVTVKGGYIQTAEKLYVGSTDKFPMYANDTVEYIDATTDTIKLTGAPEAYKYSDIEVYTTLAGDAKDEFDTAAIGDIESTTHVICLCNKDGDVTAIYIVKNTVVNVDSTYTVTVVNNNLNNVKAELSTTDSAAVVSADKQSISKIEAGKQVTLTVDNKTGYEHGVWFVSLNGEQLADVAPNAALTKKIYTFTMPAGDVELIITGTNATPIEYTITYNKDDGNITTTVEKYTIENAVTLPTTGTKEGYTFAGWKENDTATTGWAAGTTGNKTVTAQWTENVYAQVIFVQKNHDGTIRNTVSVNNVKYTALTDNSAAATALAKSDLATNYARDISGLSDTSATITVTYTHN